MKIFEFIDKYCDDLVKASNIKKDLIDLTEFQHDLVIEDPETGESIPAVLVDSIPVPVQDFLTMDLKDFVALHNTPEAAQIYEMYMESICAIEGEDVVSEISRRILAERARINEDVALVLTI